MRSNASLASGEAGSILSASASRFCPSGSLAPLAAHAARTATASSGRPLPRSPLATRDAAARAWAGPRVIGLHHPRWRQGGASILGAPRYSPLRLHPLRPDPCPPKTRADLEWDRVLSAVADRCAGPLGRDLALGLGFAETREEARAWLAQSAEATMLLGEGRPLPVAEVDDVRDAIERARVGGVLGPAELRSVAGMLGAARSLRRFLASRRAALPRLFEACATDPTLDDVADEISGCFEIDGALADRASPRLRELRGEWRAARQRMLSRMEELMSRYESVVQDR